MTDTKKLDAYGFDMVEQKSHTIDAIGYDAASQRLAIRFKGYPKKVPATDSDIANQNVDKKGMATMPGQATSLYHYSNVPPEVCNSILMAELPNSKGEPSIGATFQKIVKVDPVKYPCLKIEHSPGNPATFSQS